MDLGEFQIPGNSDPNQKTSHLSLDIGGNLVFFFFVISFWPMYLIFPKSVIYVTCHFGRVQKNSVLLN